MSTTRRRERNNVASRTRPDPALTAEEIEEILNGDGTGGGPVASASTATAVVTNAVLREAFRDLEAHVKDTCTKIEADRVDANTNTQTQIRILEAINTGVGGVNDRLNTHDGAVMSRFDDLQRALRYGLSGAQMLGSIGVAVMVGLLLMALTWQAVEVRFALPEASATSWSDAVFVNLMHGAVLALSGLMTWVAAFGVMRAWSEGRVRATVAMAQMRAAVDEGRERAIAAANARRTPPTVSANSAPAPAAPAPAPAAS